MSCFAISPNSAWLEAASGDGPDQTVWAAHLDTGQQFEFTDTGWLIWMLLSDGVSSATDLRAELERIHDELGPQAGGANFDESVLTEFLATLEESGLIVRTME